MNPSDDLDLNFSALESEPPTEVVETEPESGATDILAVLDEDDDPLDLSLGQAADSDAEEMDAAFITSSASESATDPAAWEDAPEQMTQNLGTYPMDEEEAPVLTNEYLDEDEATDAAEEYREEAEETEAMTSKEKLAVMAGGLVIVVAGIVGAGIPLMDANSRIGELSSRLGEIEVQAAKQNGADTTAPSALGNRVDQLGTEIAELRNTIAINAGQDGVSESRAEIEQIKSALSSMREMLQLVRSELAKPAARSTSAKSDSGDQVGKSGWMVVAMSFSAAKNAREMQAELANKGLDLALVESQVRGRTWYRLELSGLATRSEALTEQQRLKSEFGLSEAWIGRN